MILPSHIDTTEHWWNSFGKTEREISARLFVKACQVRNEWCISQEELDAVEANGDFIFNGLDEMGFIYQKDDKFYPTHEFVCKAFVFAKPKYQTKGAQ